MRNSAPYAPNNQASKMAAQAIQPKLTGARKKVYDCIVFCALRGATGSEIADALNMLPYTAKPRCSELRDAGLIVDSGQTRLNKVGSHETIWIKAPEGHIAPLKLLTDKQKIKALEARIERLENRLAFLACSKEFWISSNPAEVKRLATQLLEE